MLWFGMSILGIAAVVGAGYYVARNCCSRLDKECKAETRTRLLDPFSKASPPSSSIFSEPTKYLSVVIPAYEEENRLPSTLRETVEYLANRQRCSPSGFSYEVIVVDDGSKDKTSALALEFAEKNSTDHGTDCVRVLKMDRNGGKGAAVREGMLRCRGALCLFADADAATEFSCLETLEAELRNVMTNPSEPEGDEDVIKTRWLGNSAEQERKEERRRPLSRDIHDCDFRIASKLGAVFGSRAHLEREALARRAFHRNILTHGFHFLVAFVVGNRIKDTQCGFKLFTRSTASLLFPNQRTRRFCFDVELIRLSQKLQIPLAEEQVKWTEVPGSKVKFQHVLQMAWELVLIKLGHGVLGNWDISRKGWSNNKKNI